MKNSKNICLNCNAQLDNQHAYCPACGQEAKFKDLSLKYILANALESFFNFDTRFFRTIRDVWIPNRIIKQFIEGKRTKYMHPMRFLFICLVLFFTLLSFSLRNFDMESNTDIESMVLTNDLYHAFESYNDSVGIIQDQADIDSIRKHVFVNYKDLEKDTFFNGTILGTNFDSLGLITSDVYHMEPDSLWAKYNITSRTEKLLIKQIKRVTLDPNQSVRFGIANMLWGFIIITILMALQMKLLYIRHDVYYVEHLMQVNIFHCQVFLIFSILFGINFIVDVPGQLFQLGLVPLLLLIYSLKDYFKQNIFKTILKVIIFGIVYFILLTIIAVWIALLSLAVY
ncbi:MAG: DUF3667 domain-containing protein [Saprospiraceae bacterium]|nr:DUF3667 domain-containing protein [Saprospiraceae bacterium]